MESDSPPTAADLLRDVERRRLAVYATSSAPRWAWPAFGAGTGLYLASFALDSAIVTMVAAALWVAFVAGWVSVVYRRSGVQPRLRGMPPPLRRELWQFWAGGAVVAVASVWVGVAWSFVASGVLTGVAAALGGQAYERRYERAVARLGQ
jgi:DNA-binding transcriptional LysR family regulator